jgi:hypothetical protein
MGLGVHSSVQLYMHGRCHNVMIHFSRKRFILVLTNCAIRLRDCEAEKVGSLKYFETCGVQKKEFWSMDQYGSVFINPFGVDIHPNRKRR